MKSDDNFGRFVLDLLIQDIFYGSEYKVYAMYFLMPVS